MTDDELRNRIGHHTMVRFEDDFSGTCFAWKDDRGDWRVSSHGQGYRDVTVLIRAAESRRTLKPVLFAPVDVQNIKFWDMKSTGSASVYHAWSDRDGKGRKRLPETPLCDPDYNGVARFGPRKAYAHCYLKRSLIPKHRTVCRRCQQLAKGMMEAIDAS